jgi:hypothetical protein
VVTRGHKDPFMALGVCDALRDAELLAAAVDAGLSGLQPLELALAEYERRRNAATLPDYHENLHMAQLGPIPPDLLRRRQALRDKPADARQFLLARYGRIPREAFFNPANLERILSSAPTSRAGGRSLVDHARTARRGGGGARWWGQRWRSARRASTALPRRTT